MRDDRFTDEKIVALYAPTGHRVVLQPLTDGRIHGTLYSRFFWNTAGEPDGAYSSVRTVGWNGHELTGFVNGGEADTTPVGPKRILFGTIVKDLNRQLREKFASRA